MNTYILLRNNKESAPLNLDALKQLGLKSNDLIWVECQSVCWQFPHEIPALRSLVDNVPVVANQSQQADSSPQNDSSAEAPALPVEDAFEVQQPAVSEKKLVFVEMPANSKPVPKQPAAIVSTEFNDADMNKYGGLSRSEQVMAEDETTAARINYFRPLDEIKEMYVKTLRQRSSRKLIAISLPPRLKKPLLYIGLLSAGALLMYLIRDNGKQNSPALSQNTVKPQGSIPTAILPASAEPLANEKEQSSPPVTTPITNSEPAAVPVVTKTKEKEGPEPLAADINEPPVEREYPVKKETTVASTAIGEKISSQLQLSANKYVVGNFGGIRDLEISLQNGSAFLLDRVNVQLDYLSPEGVIVKTETIHFLSVSPGENKSVRVDKTKRGIKVKYKLLDVESKEMREAKAGF